MCKGSLTGLDINTIPINSTENLDVSETRYTLNDLLYLMARLRDPETGCPWDIKQTLTSINHSTIEEAYELVDALQQSVKANGKADDHVQEELGDVLFQVVFYSQLAKEDGGFQFEDVVHGLTEKLIRRHPHVFPQQNLQEKTPIQSRNEEDIKAQWEAIKQGERQGKSQQGLFDDIPAALPALIRAQKIQKRTSNVGFDWSDALSALDKVEEEIAELRHAIQFENAQRSADEMGDVLFSCVNVARLLKIDAESTLEAGSQKFQSRFEYVACELAAAGKNLESSNVAEMNTLWEQAKQLGL